MISGSGQNPSMHAEFKLTYASVVGLFAFIVATAFVGNTHLTGLVGIGLLMLGSFMVAFGFWGADYAFSVRIGELDQSAQSGKFSGELGKVFVPFLRNYTPVEWWNLNWFIVAVGVFCVGFGAYYLGLVFGSAGI